MEISVLILSCVILGLNPVLPVLHIYIYIFFKSRFVTLYGFYQIKYIHTYFVFDQNVRLVTTCENGFEIFALPL